MSLLRHFFSLILLHLVTSSPQINLDLTDWNNENNVNLQHNCLHVLASIDEASGFRQIISYCMSEPSSKWDIQGNSSVPILTFRELSTRNITSEQLYLWSAPIDLIQRYQFYLNQLSTSTNLPSMAAQLFYNCTSPWFGPLCQYSLVDHQPHHSSLNEIINHTYTDEYSPRALTCYIHLVCNRGLNSMCLDWSEICDGHVDCDDGSDEVNCEQLELNECEDNEYRCDNGQCIPKTFYHDDPNTFECLDRSDEFRNKNILDGSVIGEPTFAKEDVTCPQRYSTSLMKLTSSCVLERNKLLVEAMFDKSDSLPFSCWSAVKCKLGILVPENIMCETHCRNGVCDDTIKLMCPYLISVPASPVAFGHLYYVYLNNDISNSTFNNQPSYVCYNDKLCGGFYPNRTLLNFVNTTCRRPQDFPLIFPVLGRNNWLNTYVSPLYKQLHQCNTIVYDNSGICDRTGMYRCRNSSKCISKHRLCDNVKDCDYGDDEQCSSSGDICSKYGSDILFKCTTTSKCISPKLINDNICDCQYNQFNLCDDEISDLEKSKTQISFPTICNSFIDLLPVLIEGKNETDETECQYYPCDTIYTRCDGVWNCYDGSDEVDCDSSPLLNCPPRHHICVSANTRELMCLPLGRANDRKIDCLGATDEPELCARKHYEDNRYHFYCAGDSGPSCLKSEMLCDGVVNCLQGDDEKFCNKARNFTIHGGICDNRYQSVRTDVENFFCRRQANSMKSKNVHFTLGQANKSTKQTMIPHSSPNLSTRQSQELCHRGLALQVLPDSARNVTTITCLCPPTYYGTQCQFQNQRVSLTMQFQTFLHINPTLYVVVASLIDDTNERIIHSSQRFTYLSTTDSHIKFNSYLLYSTRPKNTARKYIVHIDIYEKISLAYRGSYLAPVKFSFLPVHRIAVQLSIPRVSDTIRTCSNTQCIHGQCHRYLNDPNNITFCRCNSGWSGQYCNIPHQCTCSPDSLCTGVLPNGQSVCVCPMNKWGSQCVLRSTACQNSTCYNGGQCLPLDEHMSSAKKFTCICPNGFNGDRCEFADTKINIIFNKTVTLSQSMLIHFVRVMKDAPPENGYIFKTIPINQNSLTVRWSQPFHIVLAELLINKYYLITIQPTYLQSATVARTINPSDRCEHISELFNNSIMSLPLLRRIKHYHSPCQRQSPQLSCFYDEVHLCLCDNLGQQRLANCLTFDHMRKLNCSDASACENDVPHWPTNQTCATCFNSIGSGQTNDTCLTCGNGAQSLQEKLYVGIIIIPLLFMLGQLRDLA